MKFLRLFLLLNAVGFLLTMASIRLQVSYRKELGLRISYLCFFYTVYPRKQKAKKPHPAQKQQQPPKKEKKNLFRKAYEEKGLAGLLHLLRELTEMASAAGKAIFPHMRAKELSLHISVAAEDAAQTAILYGQVCAAVYPAMAALSGAMNCRKLETAVIPDFRTNQTQIAGRADVKIRVAVLLTAVLRMLIQYMKFLKTATISKEQQKEKAV